MQRVWFPCFLLSIAVFINGCAYGTIFHGSKEDLLLTSSPDGANVKLNGLPIGKTPIAWQAPRNHSILVEFETPGCERREVRVGSTLSPIIIANIFPFLGFGLDRRGGA